MKLVETFETTQYEFANLNRRSDIHWCTKRSRHPSDLESLPNSLPNGPCRFARQCQRSRLLLPTSIDLRYHSRIVLHNEWQDTCLRSTHYSPTPYFHANLQLDLPSIDNWNRAEMYFADKQKARHWGRGFRTTAHRSVCPHWHLPQLCDSPTTIRRRSNCDIATASSIGRPMHLIFEMSQVEARRYRSSPRCKA